MKIVIPCANRKNQVEGEKFNGFMRDKDGIPVMFVDNSQLAPKSRYLRYVSPNCYYDDTMTFRDKLSSYNDRFESDGYNPFNLLPAYKLFKNPIYRDLVESEKYGKDGVYIFSAPWGIVRADYLLPMYDLTFSSNQTVEEYMRRGQDDTYNNRDFNHLDNNSDDTLNFIGIRSYIRPFRRLTRNYRGKRMVYFKAQGSRKLSRDVVFVRCGVKGTQNWHYQCARKKLNSQCDCSDNDDQFDATPLSKFELGPVPECKDSNTLLLPSLVIKGFRGFRELVIPELERVTLFFGKNSVGKTSVIEAIQLYAERGQFNVLSRILSARDEIVPVKTENADTVYISDFTTLFYRSESSEPPEVVIGPNDHSPKLTISQTSLSPKEAVIWESYFSHDVSIDCNRAIEISFGTSVYKIPWEFLESRKVRRLGRIQDLLHETYKINAKDLTSTIKYQTLGPHIFDMDSLANLWYTIALTEYEELIADAFTKVLGVQTERFAVVGSNEPQKSNRRRFLAKIRSQSTPIPLVSLGDGAIRLFGTVLSIINSQNGFLFIDGVENGLHYSIQENYWKLIFDMAKDFNVQVIATTHSFDCIKAISNILENSEYSSVNAVRLFDDGKQIISYEFDRQDIETAGKSNIEIR